MASILTMLRILLSMILSIHINAQSIFRLPVTILPNHYDLVLHPNLIDGTFIGSELISINITSAYFDDPEGNFEMAFNYYPNNNMVISSAEFQIIGPDAATFTLQTLSLNATTQIAIATFNVLKSDIQLIVDNNDFAVSMNFSADLRSDLAGWYLSEYEYNGMTVSNLVTQFQATDARSVFPCFDEPAFKSTFNVTFIAPADATKLSNMPILGDEVPVEGDCTWTSPEGVLNSQCHRVQFERTPRMSTYLLAFIVGGYLSINEGVQSVYYPYSFINETERGQFALDQTVDVLDVFESEDGFNRNYSDSGIPKLDSIGVSDFAAGGMENWGLMVYRATRLLVDESVSSQSAKSGQIVIIAHEVAHQWFGNLVSPSFWDDLWLNEAFSSWASYVAANLVQPGYNVMELKVDAISNALFDDASIFTPRVRPLDFSGDPTLILASFSSITYQKGMGVVNTVANYMSQSTFLEAISEYLDRFAFDTATSDELAGVLAEYEEEASTVMLSFIEQEGFPLVTIETAESGGNLSFTITQQRFVSMGPTFWNNDGSIPFITDELVSAFGNQSWSIPMLWKDGEGTMVPVGATNNIMTERQLISTKARPDSSIPEYYLANPVDGQSESIQGLFNLFRVFYDDFSFEMILDHWTEIGVQDQLLLISDRFALAMSGYITPDSYLQFLERVTAQMLDTLTVGENVPDYAVFKVIIDSLESMDDILCEFVLIPEANALELSLRANLREFAIDLLRRMLQFVVDDVDQPFADSANCPDGSECNTLQSVILSALVTMQDAVTMETAYNEFAECTNRVCSDQERCLGCDAPRILPDGRLEFVRNDVLEAFIGGVLGWGLGEGLDNGVVEEVLDLYGMLNAEGQSAILNAFGMLYVDDSGDAVRRAIDFVMSDAVRSNLRVQALVSMKKCTAREPLWSYMTDGEVGSTLFDELFTGGSTLFSQEPLTALADSFATTERYEEISTFFSVGNRTNEGTERVLSRTLESVYWRGLWRVDSTSGMETFLRSYVVAKYSSDWDIGEILVVTVGCCGGLIMMVFVYWTISKPTASDRVEQYFSRKHEKRQRRKSSMGAGQAALTSSLGHSLDQSLREHSQQRAHHKHDAFTHHDSAAADTTEAAESSTHSNGHHTEPELEQSDKRQSAGSGYGASKPFNYTALKDEENP